MEKPLDKILIEIGRLPGGKKDPFADPYGPTSNCFSSNDIVRMFELGATLLDREHLRDCATCKERIAAYAKAIQPPVPAVRKKRFGLGERVPGVAYAPQALIYSPATCVVDRQGMVQSIAMEILTHVGPELQGMEVTLGGSVVGSVIPNWEGKSFRIHNVKVSPEVVRILEVHQGYMQPVQLHFGTSAGPKRLIASCNLEFSRTAE